MWSNEMSAYWQTELTLRSVARQPPGGIGYAAMAVDPFAQAVLRLSKVILLSRRGNSVRPEWSEERHPDEMPNSEGAGLPPGRCQRMSPRLRGQYAGWRR